jgi:hypothetical protein
MSKHTSLWVIGVGTLSAAVGFQLGNLTAAPPASGAGSPLAVTVAAADSPAPATIDVAQLASALGEELGAARLRDELAASLRQELRAELRAALEEEFAEVFADTGSAWTSEPEAGYVSDAQHEERERAFESAQLALDDVRARGRFDPRNRDELRELLPSLDADAQYELMRRLSVALNEGEIEFDDPSELPFF